MSHTTHDTLDPHEMLSLDEAHGEHPHITPYWTMLWVFVILLILTALTVWTSRLPMTETMHIVMALTIAVVKALLVGGFFMHLVYDKAMNTIVVAATLFAVVLFIGLSVIDIRSRHLIERAESGEIRPGGTLQNYAGDGGVKFPLTGNEVQKVDMSIPELARKNAEAAGVTGHSGGSEHSQGEKPAAEPKPAGEHQTAPAGEPKPH